MGFYWDTDLKQSWNW